jgi:hypothetical protein
MGWVGYVERVEKKNAFMALVWITEGKNHLENRDVDGNIILRWILNISVGRAAWTGLMWLK